MKGYKAFKKGLVCKGKQYKENTVFEEDRAEICNTGMHFCKYPLGVLDYYPLIDTDGNTTEFAEVEALDKCFTDDREKYCTKKLKIGKKISFSELLQEDIMNGIETTSFEKAKTMNSDNEQIESSRNNELISSSGNYARISSIGNHARISSSGNYARISSIGNHAQISSSGYNARISSSGDYARISSSGDYALIGSSGDNAQINSSGSYSLISSSCDNAHISSSGYNARISSIGNHAQISSSGSAVLISSSCDNAHISSSGDHARISSSGEYATICCYGVDSLAKAKKGSSITLAEWGIDHSTNDCKLICLKTEYVDGEKIKEDTWYTIKNGEFVEV